MRQELAALRAKLADDASELSVAREAAFSLRQRIAAAREKRATLASRIAAKQTRVAELDERRRGLVAGLAATRRLLEQNSGMRYVLATQPRLKYLLAQSEVGALRRHLAYYDYVTRAYDRDVVELDRRLAALGDTGAALKLETNALRRLRQASDEQLRELELLGAERDQLIAAVEQRMRDGSHRLEQLELDEQRLLELVERLAAERPQPHAAQPFESLKGSLSWPAAGRVAKAPGSRMRAGGARWAGVLIAGEPGTPVRAIAAGEVVFADWFRNLGKLVIIDHGNGYMTLYGNNAEVSRKPGDAVEAGDTIAVVGAGGGEMPAGLYFELRADGRPQDPRHWFARR
ncbi:MAG: murein hydrolase activator EnvC family protein [Gammaproteobacteria bacterium]